MSGGDFAQYAAFLGTVAKGLKTGEHRGRAAGLLALVALCHVIPFIFAVGADLMLSVTPLTRLGPTTIYGYQQPWAPDTTAKVSVTDTQITIVLSQAGPTGLTADQQRIAVQSLVWTATAAAQLNVPVRVEVTGGKGAFATKPNA